MAYRQKEIPLRRFPLHELERLEQRLDGYLSRPPQSESDAPPSTLSTFKDKDEPALTLPDPAESDPFFDSAERLAEEPAARPSLPMSKAEFFVRENVALSLGSAGKPTEVPSEIASLEKSLQAATRLSKCRDRDQHFQLVTRSFMLGGVPRCLTGLRTPTLEDFVVAADCDGQLTLSSLDKEDGLLRRIKLAQFSPQEDVIQAITTQNRSFGLTADVLISTTHWHYGGEPSSITSKQNGGGPRGAERVYNALAGTRVLPQGPSEDTPPRFDLIPAQDVDLDVKPDRVLDYQDGERVPRALRACPVAAAPGVCAWDPGVRTRLEAFYTRLAQEQPNFPPRCMAVGPSLVAAVGGRNILYVGSEVPTVRLSLTREAWCQSVAVWESGLDRTVPTTDQGSPTAREWTGFVAVATDDRRILGYRLNRDVQQALIVPEQPEWECSWSMPIVGVLLVQRPGGLQAEGSQALPPWPDLLAWAQDGSLHRMRWVDRERIEVLWQRLWAHIERQACGNSSVEFLEWMHQWMDEKEKEKNNGTDLLSETSTEEAVARDRRVAAILLKRAVECSLDGSSEAYPVDAVCRLFRPSLSEGVLELGLELLLGELEEQLSRRVEARTHTALTLLSMLYQEYLPLGLQERVDLVISGCLARMNSEVAEALRLDAGWSYLRSRARNSRPDVLDHNTSDDKDLCLQLNFERWDAGGERVDGTDLQLPSRSGRIQLAFYEVGEIAPRAPTAETATSGASKPRRPKTCLLVCLNREMRSFFRDEHGKLCADKDFIAPERNYDVMALRSVASVGISDGEPERFLLLADTAAHLYLYQAGPPLSNSNPSAHTLHPVGKPCQSSLGVPRCMEIVDDGVGGSWVVVGFTRGRASRLALYRLQTALESADTCPLEQRAVWSLEVPDIHCLDLRRDGQDLLIAVGSRWAHKAVLYRLEKAALDATATPESEAKLTPLFRHETSAPVLSTLICLPSTAGARLMAGHEPVPPMLIVADQEGFVWGLKAPLRDEPGRTPSTATYQRLCWTYRMEGAVERLHLVALDGEPFIAFACATRSHLALLRLRDGCRWWRQEVHARVCGTAVVPLRGGSPGMALVIEPSGLELVQFLTSEKRQKALQEGIRLTQELTTAVASNAVLEPGAAQNPPGRRGRRAFYLGLRVAHNRAGELLDSARGRTERSLLLRALVTPAMSSPPPENELTRRLTIIQNLLGKLTPRDLVTLQALLAEPSLNIASRGGQEPSYQALHQALFERLRAVKPMNLEGEWSSAATEAALVASLQRLSGSNPTLVFLLQHPPFAHLPGARWLGLAYSRLLLEAMEQEPGFEDDPVSPMLSVILRQPPSLLEPLSLLCVGHPDLHGPLDATLQVYRSLSASPLLDRALMDSLRTHLPVSEERPRLRRLMGAMMSFVGLPRPEDTEAWRMWSPEERQQKLITLQRAVHAGPIPFGGPAENLRLELAKVLPEQGWPSPELPLLQREQWLTALRRGLMRYAHKTSTALEWDRILGRTGSAILKRLRKLVEEELVTLDNIVRPHLQLESVRPGEHGRLTLFLRISMEGHRELSQATLQLSLAPGEPLADLMGRGQPLWRRDFPTLRVGQVLGVFPVELSGADHPESIRIRSELTSNVLPAMEEQPGTAPVRQDDWRFLLPRPDNTAYGRSPYPQELPLLFEAWIERIAQQRKGAAWVVCDKELGLNAVLQAVQQRLRAELVLLESLDPQGNRLSDDQWRSLLQDGNDAVPGRLRLLSPNSSSPLLFTGLGGVVERLRASAEQNRLKHLTTALLGLPGNRIRIFVVSSRTMSALEQLQPQLRALRLQLLPDEVQKRFSLGELKTEVETWLARELSCPVGEVAPVLARLGYDLRLLQRFSQFLRQQGEDRRVRKQLDPFSDGAEVQGLLKEELRSLPVLELLCLQAALRASSRLLFKEVEAGMVSHEQFRSRKADGSDGELILNDGDPITDIHLTNLKSQLKPAHIRVKGFGWSGSPERRAPELEHLLLSLDNGHPGLLRQCFERLESRGMARVVGGILNILDPYRRLLARFYQQATSRTLVGIPDGYVFREVQGHSQEILEKLPLTSALQVGPELMAWLLPPGARSNLAAFEALKAAWNQPERAPAFVQSLFPQGASLLREPSSRPYLAARPLLELNIPAVECFGGGGTLPGGYFTDYLLWCPSPIGPEWLSRLRKARRQVSEALATEIATATAQKGMVQTQLPRLILCGPGVEGLEPDPERQLAVLRGEDFLSVLSNSSLPTGLGRRVRRRLRLTALSPFQLGGALPPGSDLFFGRSAEQNYVLTHILQASLLIMGGRRIGKTSLLHQLRQQLQQRSDVTPLYLDCSKDSTPELFEAALHRQVTDASPASLPTGGIALLEHLADRARQQGRMLVLLLNEIDGLVEQHPTFVAQLRSLHEAHLVRYVMVGYGPVLHRLRDVSGPLWNFTQGDHLSGKALFLTALEREPAQELVSKLEAPPLELRWRSSDERTRGIHRLLERSYRIPWLLQHLCHRLVAHLERAGRDELWEEDVDAVTQERDNAVWEELQRIDPRYLGLGAAEAAQEGIRLVLLCMARQRYFLPTGEAPIMPRILRPGPLPEPLDLGFSVDDACDGVEAACRQLLFPQEQAQVLSWLRSVDLEVAFRTLTLTLMLEPDPMDSRRFAFLLHIYPQELKRRFFEADPALDGAAVEQVNAFLKALMKSTPS